LQKIQHEAKRGQTGCYTVVAHFPFEPLEKCTTFKDIFPGLYRTLSFNFQDIPGPKWFSGTFQVLEFSREKSRTFQEVWEPWSSYSSSSSSSSFVYSRLFLWNATIHTTAAQLTHEFERTAKHSVQFSL